MLVRIRQQPWREARIDWGTEPVWQTALPASVFGGDTVIAFAGMPARVALPTVRLLALDPAGPTTELARGEADAPCPGDTLPRIAAARRIATVDDAQAMELAVAYQLMSKQTNCILVHERADADKVIDEAELHRVSSMLAAGWGASSTVLRSASLSFSALETPSVWRSARAAVDTDIQFSLSIGDDVAIPAFLREQTDEGQPASLQAMAGLVFEHLSHGGSVRGLTSHCEAMALHADARLALDEVVALGCSEGEAWLLLAHWVYRRSAEAMAPAVTAALQPHLDGIDAVLIDQCTKLFDRVLGGYAGDGWRLSRTRRLRRALTKSLT
jgi:hypothetical protein